MRRRFKSAADDSITITGNKALSRRPDQLFDMRKAKRVRFVDTETDGFPDPASSRRREVIQSPRSDAPKTSEYAYFRNIKHSNGLGHSRSLHKENRQSKSSKIDYPAREASNDPGVLTPRTKDLRLSGAEESSGPSNSYLFLSPRVSKHDEPNRLTSRDPTNSSKQRSVWCYKNVTPIGEHFSSSPSKASKNSATGITSPGNQSSEKGIFATKRQRLQQWVIPTSFSDVKELHSKGSDLVASLLSRLFPKSEEYYASSTGHYGYSISEPHCEPNSVEVRNQLPHSGKWNEDLRKISSGNSGEIVLSELEAFVSKFSLPNYGIQNHFQDEMVELDRRPSCHKRKLQTQCDFSLFLPIERYRPSGSCHLKELDSFWSPVEHARNERQRLLLEWDRNGGKDGVDSSIFNYESTENLCPIFATSWHAEPQKFLDNKLDDGAVCLSSLSSNNYLEFDSIPNYQSTSCLVPDFGPNLVYAKRAMAELEQFSLTSPCTSKRISLGEHLIPENIHFSSNIFLPYGDQNWLKNSYWDGFPHSDSWQKCLYGSAAEKPTSIFRNWQFPESETSSYFFPRVEETSREPLTPLSEEGAFKHTFGSFDIQPYFDRLTSRPFSFYNVSKDLSEKDLYFDNESELDYS